MYVLAQIFAFVFSDPQFALSCQHLNLGKIKISPSSSPLKTLSFWYMFQSSGRCQKLRVSHNTPLNGGQGLWQLIAQNFPTGFGVTHFVLTWGARDSLLLSVLLTKGIGLCIVVEYLSPWEKGNTEATLCHDITTPVYAVIVLSFICVNCM